MSSGAKDSGLLPGRFIGLNGDPLALGGTPRIAGDASPLAIVADFSRALALAPPVFVARVDPGEH